MSKFNTTSTRPVGHGPIATESVATARTHQGGPGYARDTRSELFLLAVTNMVSEDTFYETAQQRDSRFATLVRELATTDFDWLTRFARWLRGTANMRSASIALAAEAAKAALDAGQPGSRALIASVLQRADEPGEFIAYWHRQHGRTLPKPVKRGVADAARRLYSERSYLKWDSDARGVRFADVIRLAHVDAGGSQVTSDLYRYIIGRRLGVEDLEIPAGLDVLRAHANLRALRGIKPGVIASMARTGELTERFAEAGVTWEAVPSLIGGPWTAELWEAVIPSMGYMALLRNLRNFDQAGVSNQVAATVAARLADPEQVARSRQLPMRFLSAYNAAPSLRWSWPLEQALDASLSNIPALPGHTLIMVDTSTSMNAVFSKDGTLHRWDAAAMFGLALARRCASAKVVSYSSAQRYMHEQPGTRTKNYVLRAGESLLSSLRRWKAEGYFLGGGTDTAGAIRQQYAGHDRVVLLTDEQAGHSPAEVSASLPATVPLYTWNLAGYEHGHAPSGPNRHTFGGLTDRGFELIPLLESGRNGGWPF
ncbi:TROVE domain-containing protein [Nocardia gipuzkoensis]|uniref:TROVE domain-containing protein n=1 Tax=Nocardia gipuzkoensis TaxID=2749991 RepID=UPI00237E9207|nr:TROVE domain-containing protein [Nocardia gipuzkoensis]MDE1673844.1 TROVE domain-containing protein [Nocardia gipuzkoensis]